MNLEVGLGDEGSDLLLTLHEDGVRPESDADHTVNLGFVACMIASRMLWLSTGRVAELVLVHDLLEVIAGDTPTMFVDKAVLDDMDDDIPF